LSKYSIYRVDNPDPAGMGKRRRRLNMIYVASAFLIVLLFMAGPPLFNVSFISMYSISVVFTIALSIFFQLKMRAENRKLKIIGDIEFTRTEIVKHIGDSVEEFTYTSIKKIELEKHIPAVNIAENKSGYLTFILSLDFFDSGKERLVVSDKPMDSRHNLCITETIQTLKKITHLDIDIRK
jgi:hypothetical protein